MVESDGDSLDTKIHSDITKNLAMGSEKFKSDIQALTHIAQTLRPRWPKKKVYY